MRFIAAFLVSCCLSVAAFAQAPPSDAETSARMALARDLVSAARMDEQILTGIDLSMPIMVQALRAGAPGLTDADVRRFTEYFREEFAAELPQVMEEIAREYALRFDQADLRSMLGFYQSTAGQHLVRETTPLQQAAALIGQRHGEAAGLRAGQRMQDSKL